MTMLVNGYGAVPYGTSRLHTSVLSLHFLHHLGPMALDGVNSVETYTSVCNLYLIADLTLMHFTVASREYSLVFVCFSYERFNFYYNQGANDLRIGRSTGKRVDSLRNVWQENEYYSAFK